MKITVTNTTPANFAVYVKGATTWNKIVNAIWNGYIRRTWAVANYNKRGL